MFEWATLFFSDPSSATHVGLYFLIFLSSLALVLTRHPLYLQPYLHLTPSTKKTIKLTKLLGLLAVVAFSVTWNLIFQFFQEEALLLQPLSKAEWLASPSTFVKAYEQVTTATGYVWSSNLLMWVIPGCLFLQTEFKRRAIEPTTALAYTATGFMGAISLSFPLFFGHILILDEMKPGKAHTRQQQHRNVSYLQILCATVAATAVVVLPHTVHTHTTIYVQALLVLHVVLAVPSVWDLIVLLTTRNNPLNHHHPAPLLLSKVSPLSLRGMYFCLAGASFIVHVTQVVVGLTATHGDVHALVVAGWQNTCQSSISWDVVFTALVCSVYMYACKGYTSRECAVFLVGAPLVSLGAAWSIFLVMEEGSVDDELGDMGDMRDMGSVGRSVATEDVEEEVREAIDGIKHNVDVACCTRCDTVMGEINVIDEEPHLYNTLLQTKLFGPDDHTNITPALETSIEQALMDGNYDWERSEQGCGYEIILFHLCPSCLEALVHDLSQHGVGLKDAKDQGDCWPYFDAYQLVLTEELAAPVLEESVEKRKKKKKNKTATKKKTRAKSKPRSKKN